MVHLLFSIHHPFCRRLDSIEFNNGVLCIAGETSHIDLGNGVGLFPKWYVCFTTGLRHSLVNNEQGLVVFYRLPILHQDGLNGASLIGFDLVKQFHRFNNTQRVTGADGLADLDK